MRIIVKILKWVGIGIAGLCVVGFLYQLAGNLFDAKYAPPATDLVSVEGHAVRFSCSGHGAHTFLLDSGAGVGAFEWDRLVPLLATSGRVCVFDRPGLGWSDDFGGSHDVTSLAQQIGVIVRAAQVAKPFVYVGHSLGANDAMVYYDLYPRDVSALILIEPGRPTDLLEDFHGTRAQAMTTSDCGLMCAASGIAAWLGATRLASHVIKPGHTLGTKMQGEYLSELASPADVRTIVATLDSLPKSAYEIAAVKSFGHTPVLLLTSSDPRKRDNDETVAQFRQWRVDQLAWFAAVARMSSRGKGPIVIPNSNHATMVMSENGAAAVAQAIRDFLGSSGAS